MAAPPKYVPTRRESDVDWAKKDTTDAIDLGSSVAPMAAARLIGFEGSLRFLSSMALGLCRES
jgi:hypothetical protein